MSLQQINLSSLIVGGIILVAFTGVVYNMYKKHKNGSGGCGCGCNGCASKNICHGADNKR